MGTDVSTSQATRLEELEAIVERSAQAVWDMANALSEIKSEKLFKLTHKFWHEYCAERWGLTVRWADRMITATEILSDLKNRASTPLLPTHVSQVAELTEVPKDLRSEVWGNACRRAELKHKAPVVPSERDVREAVVAHREASATQRFPDAPTTPGGIAARAAHTTVDRAESFVLSVETSLKHLDHMNEIDTQRLAHSIVSACNNVLAQLESAGAVSRPVTLGIMGDHFDPQDVQEADVVG